MTQLTESRKRLVEDVVLIGVGTFFFLLFVFLCFCRELGPARPSKTLFGGAIFLGAAAIAAGMIYGKSYSARERTFGFALAVEGIVMVLLTLIVLAFMGPVPLPAGWPNW